MNFSSIRRSLSQSEHQRFLRNGLLGGYVGKPSSINDTLLKCQLVNGYFGGENGGLSLLKGYLTSIEANKGLISKTLSSNWDFALANRRFFYSGTPNKRNYENFYPNNKKGINQKIDSKGQRRSMFIQAQPTPNPSSLMFHPGKAVMEVGSSDFPNARSAMNSPLAKALFAIDGITRVFFGSDYITVTKSEEASWDLLKPEIFAAIMDFYTSGQTLFLDSSVAASMDTAIHEDDSEIVAMIKELLETRIRPAVQDDGGDIEYRGFDPESGVVKLKMQGACSGCPSSAVTLKSGIENMLMHYVPEVKAVEQEVDDDEDAAISSSYME